MDSDSGETNHMERWNNYPNGTGSDNGWVDTPEKHYLFPNQMSFTS